MSEQRRSWQDYGFFGPDSPSWRVWTAPTAVIGFQRSVVLEHFDPFLAAAVADQRGIYRDPAGRLDRTFAYFLTIAVADGRTAVEASEFLMKVHAKATGIEPVSGKRYSANNPDSQLWIHVTGWHSVLKCYELYGPGLTPEQEERYWQECVVAAELQTCKTEDVPRSREEVRAYFAEVRPQLCMSERAYEAMRYLMYTPLSKGARFWAASRVIAPATIASLPMWMRELGGFHRSRLVDAAATGATSIGTMALSPGWAKLAVLRAIGASTTAAVYRQHLHRGTPEHPRTVTPAEARELVRSELSGDGASLRGPVSATT